MGTAVRTEADVSPRSVASWWRGRYGARFLYEVAICGGLLMVYRLIRTVNRTDLRTAYANAGDVIRLEKWVGLPFEDNLQSFLLGHPTLIKLLNHYYIWFHFPAAIALLFWLYLRHPRTYRPVRNLMAFTTFTGLVIHLLYPLAPPRMMDGFVDTMQKYGPSIYSPNALDGAANQIAAMPSLHFAWAVIEAMAVIIVLKSRWRWAIVAHPILMTMTIIATANHWWLDAAAAGVIVIAGVLMWRLASRWIGDRHWSWQAMRFQTADGIDRLEAHANVGEDAPTDA